MLNSALDQTSIPLLEKLAVFGQRRQEAFAGNIANIDTPNYKPRDLPVAQFQQALQAAIARRSMFQSAGATEMAAADAQSFEDLFPEDLFQAVEAPSQDITFQDGSNRSIESQVMEMTKNMMMQTFAVELMTAQLNMLHAVVSERA
jgi:flagellar basal-body rod protein FlgB